MYHHLCQITWACHQEHYNPRYTSDVHMYHEREHKFSLFPSVQAEGVKDSGAPVRVKYLQKERRPAFLCAANQALMRSLALQLHAFSSFFPSLAVPCLLVQLPSSMSLFYLAWMTVYLLISFPVKASAPASTWPPALVGEEVGDRETVLTLLH